MSILFKNTCKKLGINRTSTTAYHPQGNAMIERTNRKIEESLAKYVAEHHNTWSDYPPLVVMAYRSSLHSLTKYSPFYLIFWKITRAADWLHVSNNTNQTLPDFEWLRWLLETRTTNVPWTSTGKHGTSSRTINCYENLYVKAMNWYVETLDWFQKITNWKWPI